jgi:tyrosine phenol-lyase
MDVVAESVIEVAQTADTIAGLRFTYEPKELRFFLGRFEPIA